MTAPGPDPVRRQAYAADLPITAEYDVVVVGGGSAGCAAAIQSGRLGARTALLEKNGILGGTTIVASVNFPGLFHAWGRQVIAGIGWEIVAETARRGGAELPDFTVVPERHWQQQVRVNRFLYSSILDERCIEAGVTLRFHEMPSAVVPRSDGEAGVALVVTGKTGLELLLTRTVVDATGDADIAGLMGYAREKSARLQPGTLIYELDGYDVDAVDREALAAHYAAARAAGRILPTDHRPGNPPLLRELMTHGGSAMHVLDIDGSTSLSRTQAELKARRALRRVYELLRTVPGCENLEVRYVANECGVRETWRIVGEAKVTHDTYVSGYVWPDAICHSFYPIDIHQPDSIHIDIRPLEPGVVPTIPYRALIPMGSDRLLVAGRCIAGDQAANSAYRVQATCMATGQAAGAAAALAARAGVSVRDVGLEVLRGALRGHGAIVPDDEPDDEPGLIGNGAVARVGAAAAGGQKGQR